MKISKNGFVVAELNQSSELYKSWPLSKLYQDDGAKKLTYEAEMRWFSKYDMQHIIIEKDYIKRYSEYCKKINLNTCILLFETPLMAPKIGILDDFEIEEILGYDCIGTVYYSYLQTEIYLFFDELTNKNIIVNKYGLFDEITSVQYFIELRRQALSNGVNLEDYWKEMPARISIVKSF